MDNSLSAFLSWSKETRCRICWITLEPEQAVIEYWDWSSLENILLFHASRKESEWTGNFEVFCLRCLEQYCLRKRTWHWGPAKEMKLARKWHVSSSSLWGARMFISRFRSVVTTNAFFSDTCKVMSFLTSLQVLIAAYEKVKLTPLAKCVQFCLTLETV